MIGPLTTETATPGEGVTSGVSGVMQSDVGTSLAEATVFIWELKKSAVIDVEGKSVTLVNQPIR